MPDFRKGATAIKESKARASEGGDFKPFTPNLFWTQDGDSKEKYVLFLNPMDEVVTADMIGFIPVSVKGRDKPMYESVIARTDPAIGESKDPMSDDWGADPKETGIAVAVELEPVIEKVNGRNRPVGFEVAVNSYERRVKDDKGELTDDKEEVEVPVIGFVTQSTFNFYNLVQSFDESDGPIESTPLRIKRLDKNTYSVDGFLDAPIDLSGLVETIDGLSYLGDDLDPLLDEIDNTDSDEEAAAVIGAFLLDKRLAELCDRERYDELYEGIDKPFKFGKKDKSSSKDEKPKRERTRRRSQRRSSEDEGSNPEADHSADAGEPDDAPTEEPKESPAARRIRRAKAKPVEDTAPDEEPKAGGKSKLDELREKQAAQKKKAAA